MNKHVEPETLEEQIATLRTWIDECPDRGLVFFGGAGVSTESGIPDFRSADGLYSQSYAYPPETIISHSFFHRKPVEFFRFYFDRMIATEAKPNAAHLTLARLEQEDKLSAVVTQNIDGLHQAAGSKNVLELHGSVLRNHCQNCGAAFDLPQTIAAHEAAADGVPRCTCGGVIKPDVVLYEEPLDDTCVNAAVAAIARADLMIVAGTSLVVQPAASLLQFFNGRHLVIVNLTPTPADRQADLCIQGKVGQVLSQLY